MRLAEIKDLDDLVSLYQEATTHAHTVGKIDWPNPTTESFVAELVSSGELYCFEQAGKIVAAAKLSPHGDVRIWGGQPAPATYLAKVATGNQVRGQAYFRTAMLPAIVGRFGSSGLLRLDCLADNERLQNFYIELGFVRLGDVKFFSEKQQKVLAVTRLERSIKPSLSA